MLNNTYRHMFPGLKQATAIFSVYLVYEWISNRVAGSPGHSHAEFEGVKYGGAFESKAHHPGKGHPVLQDEHH